MGRMVPMGMVSPGMPRIIFGSPVVMVRGHFGHDPFEDLHHNMQRAIQRSNAPALPGGEGEGAPRSLSEELEGLFSAFGDQHAGHVGRAEGSFEVDDDKATRFRLTAQLPGYNLGDAHDLREASESPLSVRAIGHRSIVVRGMQQSGHLIRSWQRSFALPKGSDVEHISVTYSSKSGNLTVDVPRKSAEDAANDKDEDEEEEDDDQDLPPVLRAMKQGLPGILGALAEHGGGPQRIRVQIGGPSLRGGGGFLMPAGMPMQFGPPPEIMQQIMGQVSQMHPRFHPPPGGDKPPPEDEDLHFLGCFEESQLEKVDLKYYGDSNAASFNAMYWHARGDNVPYFAMSRHGTPMGHAFTAHGFVHADEKPKWGVYDGCGSPCEDSRERWCGCANEADRGFPNADCMKEITRRFAVYRIGSLTTTEPPPAEEGSSSTPAPVVAPAVVPPSRAYWQLQDNGAGIDIFVPKGMTAKPKGRVVLLFNATAVQAGGEAAEVADAAAGEIRGHDDAPAGASLGKMRLPAAVDEASCAWDKESKPEDGSQVLKCTLAKDAVRQVPIKVIDEL